MSTKDSSQMDLDEELNTLLKEQENFMMQNKKPAAKMIRLGPSKSQNKQGKKQEEEEEEEEDTPQNPFTSATSVVGNVMERDVIKVDIKAHLNCLKKQPLGFPQPLKRGTGAGESLFGRRRRQQQVAHQQVQQQLKTSKKHEDDGHSTKEREEIEEGNLARLKEMSIEEIRQAQEELKKSLDPVLYEKFMKKKTSIHTSKPQKIQPPGTSIDVAAVDNTTTEELMAKVHTEKDLETQSQYLPQEEYAKHAWMQPVPVSTSITTTTDTDSQQKKKKRFDFDGQVMEEEEEEEEKPAVSSGLYHHGDEPNQAGYTLDELLYLGRSSVSSQRAMAFRILSKILYKNQVNKKIKIPKELAIALRCGIDDLNRTSLAAALAALHAFLVPIQEQAKWTIVDELTTEQEEDNNTFEMTYGTLLCPWTNIHLHLPERQGLYVSYMEEDDLEEEEEDKSGQQQQKNWLKDHAEAVAFDPIQGFVLKMDLLLRLQYILDQMTLDSSSVEKILDILIVCGRHSPKMALKILELTKSLQKKFIDQHEFTTCTFKVLVLIRTLCQSNVDVAKKLVEQGSIQSTKSFLALSTRTIEMFFIQRESLRIWRLCLFYGLDFHAFGYLFPLLCGFTGVQLIQFTTNSTTSKEEEKMDNYRPLLTPAIFNALEFFCRLAQKQPEAQHYLSQMNFFLQKSYDLLLIEDRPYSLQVQIVSSILRFLIACEPLASKFHLDTSNSKKLMPQILVLYKKQEQTLIKTLDLKMNCIRFCMAISKSQRLEPKDQDQWVQVLLDTAAGTTGTTGTSISSNNPMETMLWLTVEHERFLLLEQLYLGPLTQTHTQTQKCRTPSQIQNAALEWFKKGLGLISTRQLIVGMEIIIVRILKDLVLNPSLLVMAGIYQTEEEAIGMIQFLFPVLKQLIAIPETIHHSSQLFFYNANPQPQPSLSSCHLWLPSETSSNIPLPAYWLLCPLSRMQIMSTQSVQDEEDNKEETSMISHILQSTLDLLTHLEQKEIFSISLTKHDKLFHVLHIFLGAGSEILFEPCIQKSLAFLINKYTLDLTGFAHSFSINLQRTKIQSQIHHQDKEEKKEEDVNTLLLIQQQEQDEIVGFCEKFMTEFVACSFGNRLFSQCMTLFLLEESGFSLQVRKFIWKELQTSHLLHLLECPPNMTTTSPRKNKITDEQWLFQMKQAIVENHVTKERGQFGYEFALTALHGFLMTTTKISFTRQVLLKELLQGLVKHPQSTQVLTDFFFLFNESGILLKEKLSDLLTLYQWTQEEQAQIILDLDLDL